jgi:hypothetical protein
MAGFEVISQGLEWERPPGPNLLLRFKAAALSSR